MAWLSQPNRADFERNCSTAGEHVENLRGQTSMMFLDTVSCLFDSL